MNLIELYQYAEDQNIEVFKINCPVSQAVSIVVPRGNCYIGIDYATLNETKETVCLAHELGHCMTGTFYDVDTDKIMIAKAEKRAKKWAAENLVSVGDIQKALKSGYTEVWDLADYFGLPEDEMCDILHVYGFLKE